MLLNIVPGKDPIAWEANSIPAKFFSTDRNINDLDMKFANIIENDE